MSAFNAGQVDFAGSDSALNPTAGEVAAAQKRCGSAPLDLPMVVGPIALAYKLSKRRQADPHRRSHREDLPWPDQDVERPGDHRTQPRGHAAVDGNHRLLPLGLLGHDAEFREVPCGNRTHRVYQRAGQGLVEGPLRRSGQGQVTGSCRRTRGHPGLDRLRRVLLRGEQRPQRGRDRQRGGAVELSKDTASAAAGAAKITGTGDDLTLSINYATKTAGAYPIILVTYELACTKYADSAKGAFVKNFLSFTAQSGQAGLPSSATRRCPRHCRRGSSPQLRKSPDCGADNRSAKASRFAMKPR